MRINEQFCKARKPVNRTKNAEKFPIKNLFRLQKIFKTKKWEQPYDNEKNSDYDCLFNRYQRTLIKMNPHEQSLFLDLTENFLKIPSCEYQKRFSEVIKRIFTNYPDSHFYFLKCATKETENQTKSSSVLLYQLKSPEIRNIKTAASTVSVIDHVSDIVEQHFKENAVFVIVDDFVGSGKSAKDAIDYIKHSLKYLTGNEIFIVAAIAMMRKGYEALKILGYEPYCNIKLKRGISDRFKDEKLKDALITMDSIENKIPKLQKEYHYGFRQSEALVCMIRCPNNTFPVYWLPSKDAPYAR